MDEFATEFDLTNQQIVFLNEIDIVPGPTSDLSDFIHSPVDGNDEYESFEIESSGNSLNTDSVVNAVQQHQFHVIQNRNGVRHMKFRKPKKVPKVKKLVDLQQCVCVICNETFTRTKLKKHIREHKFRKKHCCDICSEEFNVLENLTLHISLHNSDGRCPQCGKIFRRLASLEGHIKSHFKNEYFVCTQGCEEMFIHECLLEQHINQFHPNENLRLQQEREELAKVRRHKRKRQILNCLYCGKEFSKKCLLIRHERIHNGEKPFKCSSCGCCFAQKNTLIIHQRRHSDQRMHKCTLCPQRFIQKGNLLSHMSKCHTYKEGETSFPCNKCSCTFKKIGTLNAHISKFHTPQELFMQSETELGFKIDDVMQQLNELHRPNSLETDLVSKELFFNLPAPESTSEEVLSNEDVNCESSENRKLTTSLSSPLKLAVHTNNGVVTHRNVMQRNDGNIRWYICFYCPKEFRRPSDLVRHIRIHTKEKPFACPVTDCNKKFSVKSSLNLHLNTHFKSSKEQTCHVCPQTFQSSDEFDNHCRLSHTENPMFQCFICSQLCITNGELKHHLKCHRSSRKTKKVVEQKEDDDGIQLDIIMKEPIILTNDGKIEETTGKNVVDHERKFECTVCPSSFKRKGHLKEHVLSHLGLKGHKCEICDKTFGKMSVLKRHLLYHSNEKKFRCEICNACFVSNNQLKRHSLKHTTQRNVMCPYCQKTFKSKATCRTHMLIHKNEWVKQFKEQIKAGQIQFEESTNEPMLDIVTSTNDSNLETANTIQNDSFYSNIQDVQEINGSLFLTNLVQENLSADSNNQFEYFLLLPTNPEDNRNDAEIYAETEQFQQQMDFSNFQFIQLEQSSLLDDKPENSCSNNVQLNYQLDPSLPSDVQTLELQTQEINLNYDCDLVRSLPNETVSNSVETQVNPINVSTANLNEDITTKHQTPSKSRTRKSTKSVNICAICLKVFQKPSDLCRHIRTHTLEKPFQCTICPKRFGLKSTLKNHLRTHDNIKQMFPCTVCWKSYSSRHSMVAHMLIHSNSKPHQCQYCSITFRTRGHLKIHQQVHLRESIKHGVSPSDIKTRTDKAKLQPLLNVINECGMESVGSTDGIGETVQVDRLETGAKNANLVKVDFCDPLSGNAIVHHGSCHEQVSDFNEFKVQLKTQKELFRCSDCDKVFKKASLLERHKTVHSGTKEFMCKICQKSYTQKTTLQAHMSLHTADGALFECSTCRKKFNFKTNLIGHERKCNRLHCKVCCCDLSPL